MEASSSPLLTCSGASTMPPALLKRHRNLIVSVVVGIVFLWFFERTFRHRIQHFTLSPSPNQADTSPAPRITVINIWNPRPSTGLSYLPLFFSGVAANPSIELIFIKFDRTSNSSNCESPLAPPGTPNVRELCFSPDEYWRLHADYMCEQWKCTRGDYDVLLNRLHQRSPYDDFNSHFRPLRAGVFAKWVHPESKIWGWSDMDEVWGSFDNFFPWDVAYDYDIVMPNGFRNEHQGTLGTFGEMTFFKNAEHVRQEYLNFPAFKNLNAFLTEPMVNHWAEEIEYSHWAIARTNLTFFRFYGRTDDNLITVYSPKHGVFALDNYRDGFQASEDFQPHHHPSKEMRVHIYDLMEKFTTNRPHRSTLSDKGIEVNMGPVVEHYPVDLWIPTEYRVGFIYDKNKLPNEPGQIHHYRKTPGGDIFWRWEPLRTKVYIPPLSSSDITRYEMDQRPFLFERIYAHFHSEKHREWFRPFASQGMNSTDLLYTNIDIGAQIWDKDGNIIRSTWAVHN